MNNITLQFEDVWTLLNKLWTTHCLKLWLKYPERFLKVCLCNLWQLTCQAHVYPITLNNPQRSVTHWKYWNTVTLTMLAEINLGLTKVLTNVNWSITMVKFFSLNVQQLWGLKCFPHGCLEICNPFSLSSANNLIKWQGTLTNFLSLVLQNVRFQCYIIQLLEQMTW